jgi:hypothetical protein
MGYFATLMGAQDKAPMMHQWLAGSRAADPANPYALAIQQAAIELRDGSLSGKTEDTLFAFLGDVLPYQSSVAADR